MRMTDSSEPICYPWNGKRAMMLEARAVPSHTGNAYSDPETVHEAEASGHLWGAHADAKLLTLAMVSQRCDAELAREPVAGLCGVESPSRKVVAVEVAVHRRCVAGSGPGHQSAWAEHTEVGVVEEARVMPPRRLVGAQVVAVVI